MSEQAGDSPHERERPPPMERGDVAERPARSTEPSNRLLRAIEELRALERERRSAAATDGPLQELDRRVERKAREVFRIAEGEDELEPPASER